MKAKIQFTVDFEDVPREVLYRVNKVAPAVSSLESQITDIMKLISENNIVSATEKIDAFRKNLTFFDSVMEDSYNVLSGYITYKSKEISEKVEGLKNE